MIDDNDDEIDFKKIFERIQKDMFNFISQANPQFNPANMEGINIKSFGFSINIGPDGIPHITPLNPGEIPFGVNIPGMQPGIVSEQPYYEVLDNGDSYTVIVELQGIRSIDEIDIKFNEQNIVIDAKNESRQYHVDIPINGKIKHKLEDSHIINGILELNIKKK